MKDKFLEYVLNDMVENTVISHTNYIKFPIGMLFHIKTDYFYEDYGEYMTLGVWRFTNRFSSYYGVEKQDFEYLWLEYYRRVCDKFKLGEE